MNPEKNSKPFGKVSIYAVTVLMLAALILLMLTDVGVKAQENNDSAQDRHTVMDMIEMNENFSPVLYNNTNGLPTSEANAIVQTNDGFIWIGSYGGLVRYDGNAFSQVGIEEGLTGVRCLFVDSKDRLWIGTTDNGATVREKDKYTYFDVLKNESSYSIAEDGSGLIYIAYRKGILSIDKKENEEAVTEVVYDNELNPSDIICIKNDSSGLVYCLTMHNDIFTMKNRKVIDFYSFADLTDPDFIYPPYDSVPSDPENSIAPSEGTDSGDGTETEEIPAVRSRNVTVTCSCILPDPKDKNKVYLGTNESVIFHGELSGSLFSSENMLDVSPLTNVHCIENIDGRICICAENGMGILNEDGSVRLLGYFPMNNSVNSVIIDYQGNLWFTSDRQGVLKIVPDRFTDLFSRYGLSDMVINTTCYYDDKLFLGTDKGLTMLGSSKTEDQYKLDEAYISFDPSQTTNNLITMLSGCRIRSIIRDSKNRVWISTWNRYGLICLENKKLTFYNEEGRIFSGNGNRYNKDNRILTNKVRAVAETEDGSILVAQNGGISVIKDGKVTANYSEKEGVTNTDILTVAEGKNKEIIAGTDGDGIFVIDDEMRIIDIGIIDGLKSKTILRIKRDKKRDLYWIVTSNSIAYMTSDYKITTVKNFPYYNNFDLYQNSNDEIWVLSSNGIYVVPAEELIANGEIHPIFYDSRNGLFCIATANSYSELTDNEDLYISGNTRVAKVNIRRVAENTKTELKASIPYIEADGTKLYPDSFGDFHVPANTKKVTVNSLVFNYSRNSLTVSYCLDGFEDNETTIDRKELDPIHYTNLPGGNYTFRMNISDPDGIIDKNLSIKIYFPSRYIKKRLSTNSPGSILFPFF